MNFLRNLFAPSVDSITAGLQRTVDKLNAHVQRKDESAAYFHELADTARNEAERAEDEALRAAETARRIKGLLA